MGLITNLAVILIAAGLFTVVSRALKQPLILGYIIAGFLVGPHLGLFPLSDIESVHEWSEIGIVFLLFALGLEFSFKKLLKVGSNALLTALVKCIGMFVAGLCVGPAMGWTQMESIFLGGLMSMSSTTIIIKAYDEMGLKDRPHSNLLFGSLVFEDLIAVLLMVLLSTLAVSNKFAGGEMLLALGKLGFFLILWFVVGIFCVPLILKWIHKFLNDEIVLIIGIGLCFLMVWMAELVGFSSALGAFVMGSILAETIEGESIEHSVSGVKNLFGAIFFVSVGMMVDPAMIAAHWLPIVILTVVSVVGILIFSTAGALITGQGVENSVHIGFSLAQLGEFAFIIAGLGCSLGVMRDFIYPVVVAVSVITTFTTPYMIKAADPVCNWLYKVLPPKLIERLNPSADYNAVESEAAQSEWRKYFRTLLVRGLLLGVVLLGIFIFLYKILPVLMVKWFPEWNEVIRLWVPVIAVVALMMPFLVLFVSDSSQLKKSMKLLVKDKKQNEWIFLALRVLRCFIAVAFLAFTIFYTLSFSLWTVLAFAVAVLLYYVIARRQVKSLEVLETVFQTNLNEKEQQERAERPITAAMRDKLAGFDVHVEAVDIPSEFTFIGKTLREMPFRHAADVNIVELRRGELKIRIPRGDELIFPKDVLITVGTTEQIQKMRQLISDNTTAADDKPAAKFVVHTVQLTEQSSFAGKTIRETDLRASGCLIVSIQRDNELITRIKADERLQVGDKIWLAGEENSCKFVLEAL